MSINPGHCRGNAAGVGVEGKEVIGGRKKHWERNCLKRDNSWGCCPGRKIPVSAAAATYNVIPT